MDHIDRLFEPFAYKSLSLANRIVMSPMTRYFAPDGLPSAGVAGYYAARAKGGAGLIITEGTFIDREPARNVETVPSFHGAALPLWADIVEKVHAEGGKIAPQLWHTGGQPDPTSPDSPHAARLESPSGLRTYDLKPAAKTMDEADIVATIESFGRAAADAERLGFDAIEFHGAHSYLFDQFFWDATNRREDRFGGATLPERTAFATAVIRTVRAAVSDDFVLIFRFSQWKLNHYDVKLAQTPAELEAWLRPLADAGIDIFDCSQRRFWEPEFAGSDLNLAGWTKKLIGRPTITVGSVGLDMDLIGNLKAGALSTPTSRSILEVAERLDRGEFDLVAVGRSLLADAAWPGKVRARRFEELIGYSNALMAQL